MALSTESVANSVPQVKVLFMGHSYIRRFGEFIRSPPLGVSSTFDMTVDKIEPIFRAIGGADIDVVSHNMRKWVTGCDPDVCILHVGDNDIRSNDVDVDFLARAVVNLAIELRMVHNVQYVIISQLLSRRVVRCTDFNALVVALNKRIEHHVKVASVSGILFWHHHGFWQQQVREGLSHQDGVHLNFDGNVKLYKSFKRALSKALSYLRF